MNPTISSPTFGLFNRLPSFREGTLRLFDFTGILNDYNSSPTEALADYYAIKSDWQAIGNDLKSAFTLYGEREQQTSGQ